MGAGIGGGCGDTGDDDSRMLSEDDRLIDSEDDYRDSEESDSVFGGNGADKAS